MNTNLLAVVNRIVAEQGEGILAEPRRIAAFFADLAKEEPKPQKNSFIKCLEHGFAQMLKNAAEPERDTCKQRLAQKLHEEEGLDLELCGDTVDLLEAVLFGAEQKKKENVCKNCGKELQEEWKTCPYCTVPVATEKTASKPKAKRPAKKTSQITSSAISSGSGSQEHGIEQTKTDTVTSSNDTVDITRKCNGCYYYARVENKCVRYSLPIHEAAKNNCESSDYSSQTQQPVQPAIPTSSGNTANQETVKLTGGQWFFVLLIAVGAVFASSYYIYGNFGKFWDCWWSAWPSVL